MMLHLLIIFYRLYLELLLLYMSSNIWQFSWRNYYYLISNIWQFLQGRLFLFQIEMFLLGHTLSVKIEVARPSQYGKDDFMSHYPDDGADSFPKVYMIAEDSRHYNVVVKWTWSREWSLRLMVVDADGQNIIDNSQ